MNGQLSHDGILAERLLLTVSIYSCKEMVQIRSNIDN